MRLVIAEDAALLREGVAALFTDAGHDVVAKLDRADSLIAVVAEHEPDLVLVDVRMPPTYRDEGLRAAVEIRSHRPAVGVLVLSQHIETAHAVELIATGGGFGYLLKDRVLDVEEFLESAARVARGGSALDPEIVAALVSAGRREDPLEDLSVREREVLQLMAEGLTNAGIARRLWCQERTVESHVRSIMTKLDLPGSGDDHRRVLAVITYLQSRATVD
ncbi:MAG: DNA-binding response regulator [Marmoricola sp.]|nr:DNA-binding response regulator [Marmoricola sp.]